MKLGKGDTVSVLTLLPAELSEEGGGDSDESLGLCECIFLFAKCFRRGVSPQRNSPRLFLTTSG